MNGTVLATSRDPQAADAIVEAASKVGLSVRLLDEGAGLAEKHCHPENPRVIVLDLDGLHGTGFDLCRSLQGSTQAPIIALGTLNGRAALVEALNAGADYYLPKPIDVDVLVAHLAAILRHGPPATGNADSITVRDLTIDTARKEIRLRGEVVLVTRAEYRLLACLSRNLGKVTSCSELVKEIGGYSCPEQEAQQIVKVHVSRLRSKIDRDPSEPSYIANVRGFGYMLERRSPDRSTP